ncbi:MAG: polysaccharide biosynthesis tyrosine autokinase [Actinomycetota bacterium]
MIADNRPEEQQWQIQRQLLTLRRRKWIVLAVTALVTISAVGFSLLQDAVYTSTAKVLVNAISTDPSAFGSDDPNLETERELASSRSVAELASTKIGAAEDAASLVENLSVDVVTGTEVLEISYDAAAPGEAQDRAQAFADAYLSFRLEQAVDEFLAASDAIQGRIEKLQEELVELEEQGGGGGGAIGSEESDIFAQIAVLRAELGELTPPEGLRVGRVVEPADLPESPSSPILPLNAGVGGMLGLILGGAVALLRERLDDRPRGRHDLEALAGAPVLGVIPRVHDWRKASEARLVTVTNPRSSSAEGYRTLRTGLLFAASQNRAQAIMVTSPHAGDGKTTTAANLAIALAQANKRTILVSADFRRPRLQKFFSASGNNSEGLTAVLSGQSRLEQAIVNPGIEGLRILFSGNVPGNPAELLGSEAMAKLIEELKGIADFVILDSAPVLAVADAMTLAPRVDAVLLVASAETTTRSALSHAREQLAQVNAMLTGVVLNELDPTKATTYPYYYGYYYPTYPADDEADKNLTDIKPVGPEGVTRPLERSTWEARRPPDTRSWETARPAHPEPEGEKREWGPPAPR